MIEEALLQLFCRWGYREIITPTMEFDDALAVGGGPHLTHSLYRFFEREGDILALRPDITTPIARVVATRLRDEPKPLRFGYCANVFRYAEPQAGRQREFYQAGVELVGSTSYRADAEIVALAVESLKTVGLKDFRIDIGQIDYYNGIMQHAALTPKQQRMIRQALLHKDYVGLEAVLVTTDLPEDDRRLLRRLPDLRGGGEVLEEAAERVNNPVSRAAVDNLRALYETLESYGLSGQVCIDLGMIKDIDYYTGMVLEAYTADMGFTIGTGGRYDNLIGQFGYQCPATGFALGVERIMLALSRQRGWAADSPRRILCLDAPRKPGLAFKVSQMLRQAGLIVECEVVTRSREEAAEYAAASGCRAIICPVDEDRVELEMPGQQPRQLTVEELIQQMGGGNCG